MINYLRSRYPHVSRDLWLFTAVIASTGFITNIIESTFNNFLSETYGLSGMARSVLEFPRELPGFSVVFVSALLFFLSSRRLASVAMFLQAAGLLLIAYAAPKFNIMLVWLFFMSLGQHLFMPLQSSIGMELAHDGKEGRRLGQLNGIRTIAAIAGSGLIVVGFSYLHFTYRLVYTIAAIVCVGAGVLMLFMQPKAAPPAKMRFILRREYSLFYWLTMLFGTRKQIFITFAPWVLVTIYHKPTAIIAVLFTVGSIIGIIFQPLLGRMIDRLGERTVLAIEGATLIIVCLGYGFAKILFGDSGFYIAAACYVLDMLLFAFGIARATYLKKIAVMPEHISPTLAMGTTIDHIFSITVALASGVIWLTFGYQYVFAVGAVIACAYCISAFRIVLPKRTAA
ncbi:MAG: MFS transporter [Spirochaetes bacterium]|nr:MFS transporter [Spirochaetota bacterium]